LVLTFAIAFSKKAEAWFSSTLRIGIKDGEKKAYFLFSYCFFSLYLRFKHQGKIPSHRMPEINF
jgi:hypothetical protein